MTYNPFDQSPIDKLTADDLQKLIENYIAEGYYVEYKSQFVRNEKIGWSIASFANSYGGWYFVGVETDENNIAKTICGFDLSHCPDPISKIREIVKSNIDPQPLFYPQVIKLEENKAVCVVYIPDEQDKPFICKNGRIYRRVGDSSDPISENNRYAIDKLIEEGKEVNNKFREFCQDERIHEGEHGWVKIFISPYPLGIIDPHFRLDFSTSKTIAEIIELSKQPINIPGFNSVTGNLPLNSGQTTFDSIIFRQTEQLAFNSLEFELFENLRAKIFIPLNNSEPWQSNDANGLTESTRKIFDNLYKSKNILFNETPNCLLKFFNIDNLYLLIVSLMSFYQNILNKNSYINQVTVVIKINNVWRHTPFFDFNKWSEYVENYGLPVIHRNSSTIGGRNGRGLLIDFNENSGLWFEICSYIGNEFGLPCQLTWDIIDESLIRIAKQQE